MGTKKELERGFAKVLFINDGLTQKEISERLNVTEKTIGRWVKEGEWENLKKSLLVTKENQLVMLYNQLDFINNHIHTREFKIASTKEADVISKLTSAIKKLETETSIAETVEVCKQLIQFVRQTDIEFSSQLVKYCDVFITNKMK